MKDSKADNERLAALYQSFLAGRDPQAKSPLDYLKRAGIKVSEEEAAKAAASLESSTQSLNAAFSDKRQAMAATPPPAPDTEQCTASVSWWGFDIVMNNKLTDDITKGAVGTGVLGTTVATALTAGGILTGPIGAAIASALAAAFAAKVAEISIVNNGSGVHWPISWPQLGAVVASLPTGPLGVLAAILVFIHPLRN